MDSKLNLKDTTIVHFQHLQFVLLVGDLLVQGRKLSLEFQHQTGQRIGVTCHFVKGLFVQFGRLVEVGQECLALKDPGMVVQLGEGVLFIIVFVVNLTYNLLDDILHGDDT